MDKNSLSQGKLRSVASHEAGPSGGALDGRQSAALREWMRLARESQPPRRAAFRPERIWQSLPVSTLVAVDRSDGHLRFHQRIEGRMVRIAFGESRRRSFTDRFAPDHLAQSLPAFSDAVRDGQVTLTHVSAQTAMGAPFDFTRLLLPFADEEGCVTRVLAVYGFDTDRLANMRAPLQMTDEVAGAGMQRAERAYLRLKTA